MRSKKVISSIVKSNVNNDSVEKRSIEIITDEILMQQKQASQSAVQSFIIIGKLLNEAKSQLNKGDWLTWRRDNIKISEIMAERHMRLAREYPNPSPVTDLGLTKAIILFALPSDKREEFISTPHNINGNLKHVADMSKRELEKVVHDHQLRTDLIVKKTPNKPLEPEMDLEICIKSLQSNINQMLTFLAKLEDDAATHDGYFATLRNLFAKTIERLER